MFRPIWIAVLLLGSSGLFAQSTSAASRDESKAVRQLLEQQSKQIEILTQQVAKLTQLIEGTHGSGMAATTVSPSATPAAITTPPLAEASAAESPKIEAGQATHLVAKGETLTSIARQYKIAVGDLQTANKIENDRKLQIGQTLVIPAKTPEAKENQ